MRRWLDALLAIVLAPVCVACQRALEHPTRGPVCERCWTSILPFTPPLCERCGDPLATWRNDPFSLCITCERQPSSISRSRAIGPYDGALRAIVHALKYDGRRTLAMSLGELMRLRCAEVLEGATVAVPVPLHRSRRRSRGFNQADDLAKATGLPCVAALERVRATADQVGLPAAERQRNVRGAFRATRRAAQMRGAVAVLVDDVSTTGATLEACARVLRDAGAREVRALTAARVPSARR